MDQAALQRVTLARTSGTLCWTIWGAREAAKPAHMDREFLSATSLAAATSYAATKVSPEQCRTLRAAGIHFMPVVVAFTRMHRLLRQLLIEVQFAGAMCRLPQVIVECGQEYWRNLGDEGEAVLRCSSVVRRSPL